MRKLMTFILVSTFFLIEGTASNIELSASDAFWRVSDGTFVKGNDPRPAYFIGANFWYGAILGSKGYGGDRARLIRELDSLKSLGITNLRILAGGDGLGGVATKIEPTLQRYPGKYDEDVFAGLDYLLSEMGKRGMSAVLYVNNAWEWSGGYSQYLEWAGAGNAVIPAVSGWPAYMEYVSGFITNDKAKSLFARHLKNLISRTNTITGKAYKDDPTIFSWQISNEPRCFSSSDSVRSVFAEWLWECASAIKSMDHNHMVSTGSEGMWGCEGSMDLYEKIHSCPDIDYLTAHIWPFNWNWVGANTLKENFDMAKDNTDKYLDEHIAVAERLHKPLVIEEFGFPRDGFKFAKGTPVTLRDKYYEHIFTRIIESKKVGSELAGANFWGWGGEASQSGLYWKKGDAYCGDPAQEQQGLNSVYSSDKSTLKVIKDAIGSLNWISPIPVSVLLDGNWIFNGKARLRVATDRHIPVKAELALVLSDDKGNTVLKKKKMIREGRDTAVFDFKLVPGFYKVGLSVVADNEEYGASNPCHGKTFNIGDEPEKIVSPQDRQPDFDAFWNANLEELGKTLPAFKLTLVPERSDAVRRTYVADMVSLGGTHISGIYVEPVKDGKYPAHITYMGYGSDPWYEDPDANPDEISFQLSIRGQGLNKSTDDAADWVTRGLDGKDDYYYKYAFADAVRAVDFIASRPKTDLNMIFVQGGSQGGALALAAASLDHRIRAVAAFVPFLSDFPDYFKMAQWPGNEILSEANAKGIGIGDLYRTLSYFDIRNLADKIACPVLMGFGLQDDVCPPHTNFAGFNMIRTSKRYICFPLSGHHVEQDPHWWTDVDDFFKDFKNQPNIINTQNE